MSRSKSFPFTLRAILRATTIVAAIAVSLLAPSRATAARVPRFAASFFSFDTGIQPARLAVGDLNGDGNVDLATANLGSGPDYAGTVSILLGHGDGTFTRKVDHDAGGAATGVALVDLNADGKLDVASTNYLTASVSVRLGTGTGGFQPRSEYGTGVGPWHIAAGDLNGDGSPDLVTSNYMGTVSVLLGKGDGTFGASSEYALGGRGRFVAIADLNGDGKADLVTANDLAHTVSVLLGNGDGTFSAHTDYSAATSQSRTFNYTYSVAIGDLNGDQKLDLAVGYGGYCWKIPVLFGNGDGTFGTSTEITVGLHPQSVTITDMNNDGRMDLATTGAGTGSGACSIALGNGDGTFAPTIYHAAAPQGSLQSLVISEVNGDEKPDLISTSSYSGTVSVLLGNGDGTLLAKTDVGVHGAGYPRIAVGDFDRDQAMDVVTTESGNDNCARSSAVTVLRGSGSGELRGEGNVWDVAGRAWPVDVSAADLNGDGFLDLAIARTVTCDDYCADLRVEAGPGVRVGDTPTGTLSRGLLDFLEPSPQVDDRPADPVSSRTTAAEEDCPGYDSSVWVALGNADGTFGELRNAGIGPHTGSVAIGDLNGDGIPDLVTGVWRGAEELLGKGDGTFDAAIINDMTTMTPRDVAIGDFNGDGRQDVVTVDHGEDPPYASAVSVLLGNGDGSFQARADYAMGSYPITVAVGDLNHDGRQDLVTANSSLFLGDGATVSVLFGNGDGTFQPNIEYPMGRWASAVAIGDLNDDGNPDLAVTKWGCNSIAVLLGRGDGTFERTGYDYGTGSGPNDVHLADMNGDGRPDLVTGNYSNVSVLLNLGVGAENCVQAAVRIEPGVVNLRSMGRWVNCVLQPPAPYTPGDIDVSSIRLTSSHGTLAPDPQGPTAIGDADGDGSADLMVKFPRADLAGLLQAGPNELTATGDLPGACFEGRATVRAMGTASFAEIRMDAAETPSFALDGSPSNPVVGALSARFSLPDAGRAVLSLYDVAGREVARQEVGGLGPGRHTVAIGGPALAPGVYVMRLARNGTELSERAIVIR